MVNRIISLSLFVVLTAALAVPLRGAERGDDTMTGVNDGHFRTLSVHPAGDPLGAPIIFLNSDERVIVSFDELAEDNSELRYRVVHCNADWRPSGLIESEYVSGMNMGYVDNWDYSRATTVHYVHYTIVLPNEEMRFLVSGNYLLQVYRADDPDDVVLQARFMVSEQTAGIEASLMSVTDVDYNREHQQMSLTVDVSNSNVSNPYNDLIVAVSQNGRLDNEVALRQPLYMRGGSAVYEHMKPLIFKGGNEYRRFENVSVSYPGRNVAATEYHYPYYHTTLVTDRPRSAEPYLYDSTQHGAFVVREYNSSDSDIEADYVLTHFSLESPELEGCAVFLDGDFVCRRFDPESMMVYNRATGRYEKTILLKQGAYNYQYLVVAPGASSGDTAPIEGDFYQTANQYMVKVYTRRPTDRYDRLIGYRLIGFQ